MVDRILRGLTYEESRNGGEDGGGAGMAVAVAAGMGWWGRMAGWQGTYLEFAPGGVGSNAQGGADAHRSQSSAQNCCFVLAYSFIQYLLTKIPPQCRTVRPSNHRTTHRRPRPRPSLDPELPPSSYHLSFLSSSFARLAFKGPRPAPPAPTRRKPGKNASS